MDTLRAESVAADEASSHLMDVAPGGTVTAVRQRIVRVDHRGASDSDDEPVAEERLAEQRSMTNDGAHAQYKIYKNIKLSNIQHLQHIQNI